MSLLIVNTIQPQTGSIVNISGSLQISQSLIVADDITLSGKLTLGDANTDNIIVNSEFTSSLIPDIDGAFNLGTGVKKWGTVFAKSGSFDNISGSVNLTDGLVTITSASISYLSGSSPITVGGAIIPDVSNTHNLGSATRRYNNLFAGGDLFINDISASGDVTSSGTGSFTGGIDAADATGSFGYISASGTISTSGNILANSITAQNGGELTGVIATSAQPQITSLGTITNLAVTNMTSSGNVTASSFQTNNITITAGGHVSASRVSASAGFEADTASTSSFGYISASGDISTSANLLAAGDVTAVTGSFGSIIGTLGTAAQPAITSLGTIPQLFTTNITASNNISASQYLTNNITIGSSNISGVGQISASRVSASAGFEADTTSTSSFGHISASGMISTSGINVYGPFGATFFTNTQVFQATLTAWTGSVISNLTVGGHVSASRVSASAGFEADTTSTSSFGYISASGDIVSDAFFSGSGFNTTKNFAASADAFSYSVNGRKVEVRNQLQAQLNDGTFTHLELRNTSIATDSIVLGSFTGNTATNITGSIITAATTALYTASIQIHNETGENIANDTAFTASFIVL